MFKFGQAGVAGRVKLRAPGTARRGRLEAVRSGGGRVVDRCGELIFIETTKRGIDGDAKSEKF